MANTTKTPKISATATLVNADERHLMRRAGAAITAPSWEAAREQFGLGWDPVAAPLVKTDREGLPVLEGMGEDGRPVYAVETMSKKVVRSDNWETLGTVRASYEVIDHTDMGLWFEAALKVKGTELVDVREMHGGKRIVGTIALGEARTFEGDFTPVKPYLAFSTWHDGSGSMKVIGTGTRMACTNQWNYMESMGRADGFAESLWHTKNWREQVYRMQELVAKAQGRFDQATVFAEDMLSLHVSERTTTEFITEMVPLPKNWDELEPGDFRINRVEQRRDALRTILASPTTAPIAHTAYGLVQAYGELQDWSGKRQDEARFTRNVLEANAKKISAVNTARRLALAA